MFDRIIVKETSEGMAHKTARAIQRKIMENNEKKIPTVLGLATGSTPEPVYEELVRMHEKENLDFSSVITFNLDEYLGLGPDHPQSYNSYMHTHLFNRVNIKKENIHMLEGRVSSDSIEKHVKEYEEKIKQFGGIDIQILGLGVNGHIGFNEPGSPLDSSTRLVQLDDKTREANKRFFSSKDDVPTHALTMGIGTILQYSKACYLLATGPTKADIIAEVTSATSSNQDIPATALYNHQNVTVILDEQAASKLPISVKPKTTLLSSKNIFASPKMPEATQLPGYDNSTPTHVSAVL